MSNASPRRAVALAVTALCTVVAPAALATDVSVAIFLPQATFADNASRATYANKLAAALTAAGDGDVTFRARAFARRGDLATFLKAGKVDLLIADPVFVARAGRGHVIAHAVGAKGAVGPAAVLYVGQGVKDTLALRGAEVAVADAGDAVGRLYANTALRGEVNPKKLFGTLRPSRDAAAALSAVKAGKARAAFAPAGNPAATGLRALAQGGHIPLAVAVDVSGLPADLRARVLAALRGGAGRGGGVHGWSAGPGAKMGALLAAPKVERAKPKLSPWDMPIPRPAPVQLRASGELPAPEVGDSAYEPTIPEEP